MVNHGTVVAEGEPKRKQTSVKRVKRQIIELVAYEIFIYFHDEVFSFVQYLRFYVECMVPNPRTSHGSSEIGGALFSDPPTIKSSASI